MEKTQLKNILTKIGQINPKYTLEDWIVKKPELIQLLETEFFKMQTYLSSKSKSELKILCKNYRFINFSITAYLYVQNPPSLLKIP
jgi:hypothetical protein